MQTLDGLGHALKHSNIEFVACFQLTKFTSLFFLTILVQLAGDELAAAHPRAARHRVPPSVRRPEPPFEAASLLQGGSLKIPELMMLVV